MRRGSGWTVGVLVAFCVTNAAPLALSAPKKDPERTKLKKVERYKKKAFKLFSANKFEEGIAAMEKAHALVPHPGFLLNVAVAYEQWGGHCVEALATFERFFTACAGKCELLGSALARQQKMAAGCTFRVHITTAPPGATISVDDQPVGKSPLSPELSVGGHRIFAALAGHEALEEAVTVAPKADQTFDFTFTPLAVAPPPPRRIDPPPPPPPVAEVRTQPPGRTSLTPWAWTALGVGAAGAAVGVVFTLQTFSELNAEEDARAQGHSKKVVVEHQDAAVRNAWIAHVGYGVAAAGLVTGILFFALDGDDDEALSIAPTENGVVFGGRF